VIVGTVLLNLEFNTVTRVIFIGLPVAVFILGLATLEQKSVDDNIVRLLTVPWLVWLGGTSYVFYLSHGMFFRIWSRILPVTLVWVLPMIVGAIITGALGYIFWEQPILTYLKRGEWIPPRLPILNIGTRDRTQTITDKTAYAAADRAVATLTSVSKPDVRD
jgi:peptidoglycan/LPS O-acetylase OafA/YrhL